MTDLRSAILAAARATLGASGPEPWARESGIVGASKSVSWCGLWVRAIWRRAGLTVPDWKVGQGNVSYLRKTTTPEPGDLCCWRGKTEHQSLFVRDEDGVIVTLDANTTGKAPDGTPVYATVAEKRRASADVLAYYSAPLASATPRPVPVDTRASTGAGLPDDQCRGLDVSQHQAVDAVDWHAAARAGYRYGIVRLTNGTTRDERCVEHARRIRDAGLVLGAYLFHVYWREPADMVAAFLRDAAAAGYGQPGDLIPWLDVESWRGASGQHNATPEWSPAASRTADALAAHYGSCAVYLNAGDWARMGSPAWIGNHPLAVAHYTDAASPLSPGQMRWAWWQHRVDPIPGVASVRIDQSVARLPLLTIRQPDAQPTPRDSQRVDRDWIPVGWDHAEHSRLRNLAEARKTDRGEYD